MRLLLLLVLAGSLGASACASSGAIPRPYPGASSSSGSSGGLPGLPAPDPAVVPSDTPPPPVPSPLAAQVLAAAQDLVGSPYRAGGADPDGFDCSGFVQFVFAGAGVRLPRSVREQWASGTEVDADAVEAGDLVFFAIDGERVSHVGIALDGDRFVHAPSARGAVRVERLSAGYWAARFAGARRVVPAGGS